MTLDGAVFVIIGALEAFPRRLAEREIKKRGAILRRGLSRQTDFAVFGHLLIERAGGDRIAGHMADAAEAGATSISESNFLIRLGLAAEPPTIRQFAAAELIGKSGLAADIFERLRLFDAFEFADEPFGFADLVAAKQYARLIGDGVNWLALLRALYAHRSVSGDTGISQMRLEKSEWNEVLARNGPALTELSGQHRLALASGTTPDCADALFEAAEEAEDDADWDRAASLYRRCLAIAPNEPVIAFNLSHALMRQGDFREARHFLTKVLRLAPDYAEAWYNLAKIAREENEDAAAKRHLQKAIAADPTYPDPLYNLALIEFDAGDYAEASRLWEKYRELDPDSAWSQKAKQGLQLVSLMVNQPQPPAERPAAPESLRVLP